MGGGNVAMDAARSALRLGAETVYIVYRRGMAELPARLEEVEHAEEEGIVFKTLCNPVSIQGGDDGFVKSITCIEMELGEPDESGRRRPIEKKGSEFTLDVDTVIMSLGTSPNPLESAPPPRVWRPTATAASSPLATTARPAARVCMPAATL